MTIAPYTPAIVAAMELDPELVADLDDNTLLLSLDVASADDRVILMAEVEKRGLSI